MPTATETSTKDRALEEELHELEQSEAALEDRTNSLALTNVLSFVFAFFAFGASIAAIVLAVSNNNDNAGMGQRDIGATSGSAPSAAGGGMMGSQAGGMTAPAGVHTVQVKLGEMWVRPQYTSVPAGKVTFFASNTGRAAHELMIERMPIKMDGPGRPNEAAAQGMIEDMEPGASGKMMLKRKPGSYVLFCNVPGHYAAGQHVRFNVTAS